MDEAEQEDRYADARLARQLLRGGVGQRHVRRALRELADHRQDLVERMLAAGQPREAALRDARQLLGDRAVLAAQMMARPELRSRARRFAWLLFGLAPLPLWCFAGLAAIFATAAVYEGINFLWHLPQTTERQVLAIGRPLLLWIDPLLVGLLLCRLAVQRWIPAFWPLCAAAIIAWCSGSTYYTEHEVAFGMPPRMAPGYVRVATLFGVLAAAYLWLRRAEQRKVADA
jgi:hypothetical protein